MRERMRRSFKMMGEKIHAIWEHVMYKGFFRMQRAWNNEDGITVVEIILVLVVLIGLVLIFKSQLTELIDDIFETITNESSTV